MIKNDYDNYLKFLENKTQGNDYSGFEVSENKINSMLYPFQNALTRWALKKGRSAIFADCGLGKTPIQLEWAQKVLEKTNKSVLIITPLAVSHQTIKEGEKFNVDCSRSINGKFSGNQIIVTNYERLHYFNPKNFAGIVCDECFTPDTPIDVFNIDNTLTTKYIKDINIGDRIYNAGGLDYVHGTYKRPVNRAIQITIKKRQFTCSENHPFFTLQGWKCAKDIQAGDCLMATEEAVRLVRNDFSTEVFSQQESKILRNVLLSEMANEHPKKQNKSTQSRSYSQTSKKDVCLVPGGQSKSIESTRKNSQFKPNGKSCQCKKNDSDQNQKPNSTLLEREKGGKWTRAYFTGTDNEKSLIWKLVFELCNYFRKKTVGLSYLLQSRFRKSGFKNSNRSRWAFPLFKKRAGHKKRQKIKFIGVESVAILEQGNPKLEKYRDETGIIYFYDIEAKQHPSFSVNNCLVHNSSAIKNFQGKTKTAITEFMRTLPYRLLCTATASPNDYIELGTSSEALGELGRMDMLSMFFKNDENSLHPIWWGARWRFKAHAEEAFWKWIVSWARALRRPSDMGFSDNGFILPELIEREHVVKSGIKRKGFFPTLAKTLKEQREERRLTLDKRCHLVAELVNHSKPAVVWCHLNTEADMLEKIIPDAKQISGSNTDEEKEELFSAFANGQLRVLVTKPKIGAFGLNWQHCAHETFFPSHSFEQYYQGVRRCWRFGQKKKVIVDMITSEGEQGVMQNLQRKAEAADKMFSILVKEMMNELKINRKTVFANKMEVPPWLLKTN